MQHFYDGAIRKYITQTIRLFSEFSVRYSDGSLHRVPVGYGDADRQAQSIVRQNSENTLNSVPKIGIYVYGLELDKDRLSDSSFVNKTVVYERDVQQKKYTSNRGRHYTIERLMPTPFKLTLKVDIWTANTDQKLQLLEQILMLFNPSLEIQTSDNWLDWTSLSVIYLDSVTWSSKAVPVGTDTPIDIATLTFSTPIWISPPAKVKQLGVITKIITSIFDGNTTLSEPIFNSDYIDPVSKYTEAGASFLTDVVTVIENYSIEIYDNQVILLDPHYNIKYEESPYEIPERFGMEVDWNELLERYPKKFIPGFSRIVVSMHGGGELVGTLTANTTHGYAMDVVWDTDTKNQNTLIDSQGYLDSDVDYFNLSTCLRASPGTFNAIINPYTFNPHDPDNNLTIGDRYLIIEDIGSVNNEDGALAWKATNNTDLIAHANDILEWSGTEWHIIFDSVNERDTIIWQTNIRSGIQFTWNGVSWTKSFEGFYRLNEWRLEL
jgi:hypothetical protein